MTDHKNMLLAIVLSALVLIGWGFVSERYFPTAETPPTKIVEGKSVAQPQPGADPAADTPTRVRDRALVLSDSPRLPIATPSLQGSINLTGARIDDLTLIRHRESLEANSPAIRLLSPAGAAGAYYGGFGWTGEGVRLPGYDARWTAEGDRLTPETPVTLRWDNGQGQVFQLRLSIDDGYMFTAQQSVLNRGSGAIAVRPYALVSRATASTDPDGFTMHIGPVGVFDGAANYDVDYKNLNGEEPGFFGKIFGNDAKAGENLFNTVGGWAGFGDKYWLTAIIPSQDAQVRSGFRARTGGNYQADATAPVAVVAPSRSTSYESRLFAGAKEIDLLDHYEDDLGIALFDNAIDWGWFEWFMKPLFLLLNWLFSILGNFGFAIIVLVLIVRLLLFPIAQKQFKSMAAMRVLQPKMKAIQDKHKEDKPRLQQEMLKLYQEEKVNPLAGCLPILLQIPIFYALYKVLLLAVEMRHQPFVGWIKDLSAPDPLTPVNLFGFLPFTPPSFLLIGILPIIVGVTMWLQFKLNPQPTDPIQAQVFSFMPWILMVVMAPFAAGLQLYWATGNILTILQQKWLYSRYPGMKDPVPAVPAK